MVVPFHAKSGNSALMINPILVSNLFYMADLRYCLISGDDRNDILFGTVGNAFG